jgi:hypothetical protein
MQQREAMQCRTENMQRFLDEDAGLVVQFPCRIEFDHETLVSRAYIVDSGHRQAGEASGQTVAESQRFDVGGEQKKTTYSELASRITSVMSMDSSSGNNAWVRWLFRSGLLNGN